MTGPTTRWWCEWAWLGGDDLVPDVLIEWSGERITDVRPGVTAGGVPRRPGVTLPGLVNAHSHAFHRALRGRSQRGTGSFWTWRDGMYALAAGLDPDRLTELATAAYAEMARAGITTVGEFHYLHHRPDGGRYDDPNAMGMALVAAAGAAGVRLTLLDTCYLAAGFGRGPEGVQHRFSDGDVDAWAERTTLLADRLDPGVRHGPVRVGAAIHSVRAVPVPALGPVGAWANGTRPLHVHLSEQAAENTACLDATGLRPTALLDQAGVLGPGTTALHATVVDPADVATLGRTGTGVCFCPTTERDLADGVGPAGALRAAGCPLSLGSDSHAVVDLFEEARAVELDERLVNGVRGGHRPADLLSAATVGGAGALGWPTVGRLAAGWAADLITVALDGVRTAGTVAADGRGGAAALVFAAGAADVTDVVVAGRPVVTDGVHTLGHVGRLLGRAVARAWGD